MMENKGKPNNFAKELKEMPDLHNPDTRKTE
jgi:hypothetical protein